MKNNVVAPRYAPAMLKEMTINFKEDKNVVTKPELFIYDMLRTNNWERPMYYATTVEASQYAGLDKYFQQTGMAYRIVPLAARDSNSVDTEKMYDNVMNKFKWGGIDNINPDTNPIRRLFKNNNVPSIYLDENVMRMCKSYRINTFTQLANRLINEGETEKALKVLDKGMEAFPAENVPMDRSVLFIGQMYYRLGEKEKSSAILEQTAKMMKQNLDWYFRLRSDLLRSIHPTVEWDMFTLQDIVQFGESAKFDFVEEYKKTFESYIPIYLTHFPQQPRSNN
jgi:tetratricopeptide (TPR) repeat protein